MVSVMKKYGFSILRKDQIKNKNTLSCTKAGIKVLIGHIQKNIKNATIIVRSSAIKDSNFEIKESKKKKKFQFTQEQKF